MEPWRVSRLVISILPFVVVAGVAVDSIATTWRVERDGSGDFQVLQYAIDAAAAGDTILIGPGRYEEFFDVEGPSWTRPAVAWIDKDTLTIIGAGRESTILGPVEYFEPGVTAMIMGCAGQYRCEIRGVTIEGAYDGIYWWQAELDVSECTIRNCEHGVYASHAGTVRIEDTWVFSRGGLSYGIFCYAGDGPLVIAACEFSGGGGGVGTVNTDAIVERCGFTCRSGISAEAGSSIDVVDCTMNAGIELGISVVGYSVVEVFGSCIHATGKSIFVYEGGEFRGINSVFAGGGQYNTTIGIAYGGEATIQDCYIMKEGEFAVRLEGYTGELVVQDMTNNYWGTTDTSQIDAWIWDGHDDPTIHSVVNYLPIADGPVQTESATWGAVKTLFR